MCYVMLQLVLWEGIRKEKEEEKGEDLPTNTLVDRSQSCHDFDRRLSS